MHQAISAFTRDSAPCATPDDVAETLRYLASPSYTSVMAQWEREDIARYSRWIADEAQEPEYFGIVGDLAARQIAARPAIMWG